MMSRARKDNHLKIFQLKNTMKNMKEILSTKTEEIDFFKQQLSETSAPK